MDTWKSELSAAVMIKLEDIVQSDHRIREVDTNAPQWPGLVKSIAARGVLEPVSVREVKDPETGKVIKNKWELISGGHRHAAAILAKLKEIPAIVFFNITDDELIARQAISNMHRIPQKVSEILDQIKSYSSRHLELTQKEVAAWFDIPEQKFGQILNLRNLTEASLKAVDAAEITLSNAFQLAKLDPEDQTKEILGHAKNEVIGDFSARVKRIRHDRTAERRGLPKKEGFDPKLLKKKELEELWSTVVYDWESIENDTKHPNYAIAAAAKLVMDKVFQVDPDSIVKRQAEEDEKKDARTLVNAEKEIIRKKKELDQLNIDLATAKTKEMAGV